MKIDRLDLIAYGHLTDVSIDLSATPNQFHMIVGKNESGKSSSMRAIDAWLFGFPARTKDDYLHSMKKLRVGGVVSDDGQTLHCIRKKGNRATLLDGGDGKTAIDDARLRAMLGGVDQPTFQSQFLIDHEELIAGGQLVLQGEGELGEMLFAAGAGLGRLKKIQDQIREQEESLFKRLGKSKIGDALRAVKETREQLKQSQVPPIEYGKLQDELAAKQAELRALKEESESLSEKRALLKSQVESLPIIPAWLTATEELSRLANAPDLADDFSDRRRELQVSMTVTARTVKRLTEERDRLSKQCESLPDDSSALEYQAEIEALDKELPVREKGEVDRTGYMTKVLNSQKRDLVKRLSDLAQDTDTDTDRNGTAEGEDDLTEQIHQFQLNETQRNKVGRLAANYAKLVATKDDAQRAVSRLQSRIKNAKEELRQAGDSLDANVIARTLDQVESPSRLEKSLSEARQLLDRQSAKCEATRKRLSADMPMESLVTISLPDPKTLSQLARQIEDCEDDLQAATRQRDDLQRQLSESEIEYEASEADTHLPSAAALQEARSRRDEQLSRLSKRSAVAATQTGLASDSDVNQSEESNMQDLIQWVRRSDEIVDQLRLHQKEVTQRESMVANIRRQTTQLAKVNERVVAGADALAESKQQWRDIWSAIGVVARSPAAMKDWADEHEKLLEQSEVLGDYASEVKRASSAIRLAIQQLKRVVGASDAGDEASIETLLDVHDRAKGISDQQDKQQRVHDSLEQKIAGWQADLPEAETVLSERNASMQRWQSQWDEATESLSSASPTPDDVVPMLDAIKDLTALKKERDDLLHRMASIENETTAFVKSATRLIANIDGQDSTPALDCDDTSVLLLRVAPIIQSLRLRCTAASDHAIERQRLLSEIKEKEIELQRESTMTDRHAVTASQLCDEAGCEDLDQLPEIESRSRQRSKLAEQVRSAESELKRLAAGKSIETLVDSIGDVQEGVLEDQQEELGRQRDQLVSDTERVTLELGELNLRVKQVDGGTIASDLSQTLASQLGEIGHDAEEYVRLRLAGGILRRAIEHYRGENQEPVLKIAEGYFRDLTCGAYVGLKVDYDDKDQPVLHGVRDGQDNVPASGMSDGTADSLYLGLRLASLKHRCDQGKPMPLIVDDCLQQLDNDRAVAAMKVLSQLSTQTQVIMFTHHDHLEELAKNHLGKNDAHVHRLAR